MKNAERIRSMNDEELAEMLYESDTMWDLWCNDAIPVNELKKCIIDDCKVCILKWLKEEVKEVKNGST